MATFSSDERCTDAKPVCGILDYPLTKAKNVCGNSIFDHSQMRNCYHRFGIIKVQPPRTNVLPGHVLITC